jgi:hypothetical protein
LAYQCNETQTGTKRYRPSIYDTPMRIPISIIIKVGDDDDDDDNDEEEEEEQNASLVRLPRSRA